MEKIFESKALEANLVETRHEDIEIPEKHNWFIGLSAEKWGINKRTEEFILEYNHNFVNYDYILENLHNISLTDLWFYNSIEESEEALIFLIGIFEDLYAKKMGPSREEQLMKIIFKFIDQLLKEGKSRPEVIKRVIALIKKGMASNQDIFIRNAGFFKNYLSRVAAIPEFNTEICSMTKDILLKSTDYWKKSTNAEEWFDSKRSIFQSKYASTVSEVIGAKFFDDLKQQIENSQNWEEITSNLFFNDIANHFRHFSDEFELSIEKIQYLFFIMHLPGMNQLKNHLLYSMNRLLKDSLIGLENDERYEFIDKLFSLFVELNSQYSGTVLDCISTLGKEIVDIDDLKLISYFNRKLISFGFINPGNLELTIDWQIKVNTNHVKNIRVWLELIERAPNSFKKLLAALLVNVRLGGIFISDTDLFQRDVTKLLNSEIAPVYNQIKQLARFFPVYFREIGAEGKLREATTAMDELARREDRLIHFVRKQIHTESNNTHIDLIQRVGTYWLTGDTLSLSDILPPDLKGTLDTKNKYYTTVHKLMKATCKEFKTDYLGLLTLPETEVVNFISGYASDNDRDKKRLIYLIQINNLLIEKYTLETIDIVGVLEKSNFFSEKEVTILKNHMTEQNNIDSLNQVYLLMGKLKNVILDPKKSQAYENIYYKRHIAIGIPSMYGKYSEPKFEALGLMYRLEKVASSLMNNILGEIKLEYITAKTLNNIYEALNLFKIGLELDGMENQSFNSNLEMFRYSLSSPSFTLEQYINIFQFMALNIKEIINEYFMRFYDAALGEVVPRIFDNSKETLLKKSEGFYREILSSAFLIQQLDNFISDSINKLHRVIDNYSQKYIRNMMTYNPDLTVSPFNRATPRIDNRVFLGAKAYYLKKLTSYNFPIPAGFVLTTEVFRHMETVLDHPYMSLELEELIYENIREIERITKQKFGDKSNPLLLSVRSGTAISLPGGMSTFLNVGINDEIATNLAKDPDKAWMSWDSYRRFIQSWGMFNGIERSYFDIQMKNLKEKYGVVKKADFNSSQMKELVDQYKVVLLEHKVFINNDPYKQLKQAINMVLDSWNTPRAISYRKHLQIADEWGTAVIVQKMVMGNKSKKSGSGVVFTHNPKLSKPGINLYGDFTLCSQGEDIVAGLVHTLPISENQRKEDYQDSEISLKSAFPKIYKRLKEISWDLIYNYGFSNQEIEFTFESEEPEDLYILQTREQIINAKERISYFNVPAEDMKLIGRGIGTDGGCLTGKICFDMEDLNLYKKESPEYDLILVRPDTVPDDIPKIFICDGLVTSRGGVTSHSAVTAGKLGKVCIVNCRDLVIDDMKKECIINKMSLKSGDIISIDGKSGNIFWGSYPIDYM
ncbi:pyruvate phosphate dikinase [Clostridia bacterium]|nr:pyruvate phosphate dikinase [Clostridia bacterium]